MTEIGLSTVEKPTARWKGAYYPTHCWPFFSKELNAPLVEAIKQAKFPHDSYQTTTIINTDDAIFGTGVFVKTALKIAKRVSIFTIYC